MFKKIFFILLVLLLSLFLPGEKVSTLKELAKPESITMDENELYVVEGATIFVYSSRDFSLLRKFGTSGQGPGELLVAPNYSNKITLLPESLMVETLNKLVYFTRKGKLIRELKKTQFTIIQTLPLGNNFVVYKLVIDTPNQKTYSAIAIYDAKLKEIKELYRMKFMQQGQPPNARMDMLFDYPTMRIYKDKIFIEESADGFVIEIFDQKGKKLSRIQKDYEVQSIPDVYRESVYQSLKGDRLIKLMGGWDNFKRLFNPYFPASFPPIRSIEVVNDKIYVQTYKVVKGRDEFMVLDFMGNLLKTVYLPKFKNISLVGSILGTRLHLIHGRYLYYLLENEDSEQWHLYRERIDH